MEIFATIFAGLGLFFIGIKEISAHLKQMSGNRFRQWIAGSTKSRPFAGLLGVMSGAVFQSSNAVTFVVISMVKARLIEVPKALPVVAWANVGTAALVFLATLDIHLLVLYLLGSIGLAYYLNIENHDKYRNAIKALLGVALLFLGLSLIKSGAEPLKQIEWVQLLLAFSANSFFLSFIIGAVVALITQSSATVSVIAVTMVSVGLLTFEQTILIVFGASIGTGLNTYLLSSNLAGTDRQLALIQVWLKIIGVALLLPIFILETHTHHFNLYQQIHLVSDNLAHQIAIIYLLLQLSSATFGTIFSHRLYLFARRCSPEEPSETLAQPKYLYAQALDEAESALSLVEREQSRLAQRLPKYLNTLRQPEPSNMPLQTLHQASAEVATACQHFLSDLMMNCEAADTLERIINIRARNDVLMQIQSNCDELAKTMCSESSTPAAVRFNNNLLEGLHSLLLVFSDACSNQDDAELLLLMSGDRSTLMERIRGDLLNDGDSLSSDTRSRIMTTTSLYERLVWLMNRYATLLTKSDNSSTNLT